MRSTLVTGLIATLIALYGLLFWAQTASAEQVSAYVLDHPNDPERLVLATPVGRFQILRAGSVCEWLTSYTNVTLDSAAYQLGLATLYSDGQSCDVDVLSMVDSHPCFGYDVCDVIYELPED
jgi:hypothetical protein